MCVCVCVCVSERMCREKQQACYIPFLVQSKLVVPLLLISLWGEQALGLSGRKKWREQVCEQEGGRERDRERGERERE